MQDLPVAILGTEDARHAQRNRDDLVASGDLRLKPLDLENVAEVRR
jgi:hypothetical protein